MAKARIENDKCGICLSAYTEPRLLDCYHIFCTPCLENLGTGTDNINCPLCRTKIILPSDGVGGLKMCPYFVSQRNDQTELCALCFEENIAVVKCVECKCNLCPECRDYHKRLKSSRNHKLRPNPKSCDFTEPAILNKNDIDECNDHKKILTLFCKPCNQVLCTECKVNSHVEHEVESLNYSAGIKRDILMRRNVTLKSKIPLLENYIESVKMEEADFYRYTNQMKKEIKSHATCIKELFCKSVDILTKESIDQVEKSCKTNTKNIQVYTDELEVEKMSISHLQKTTEMLIKSQSDLEILHEYCHLSSRLDKALKDTGDGFPHVECLEFEQGVFEQDKVKDLFGKIIESFEYAYPTRTLSRLNLPELDARPRLISSFTKPERVFNMVSVDDDNVWMTTKDTASLHSVNGTLKLSICSPDKSTQILKKSDTKEIWFWCGQSAKHGQGEEQECYKIEGKGHFVGCCFLDNGNLMVYNTINKSLNEVSKDGCIERIISNSDLQKYRSSASEVVVTETKVCNNLVISQGLNTVLVMDQNGYVKNKIQRPGAQFSAVAADINGNILVADFGNDILTLFSEDGVFLCDLLTNDDGIYAIENMALDECGNLWLSDGLVDDFPTTIKIFSYS